MNCSEGKNIVATTISAMIKILNIMIRIGDATIMIDNSGILKD